MKLEDDNSEHYKEVLVALYMWLKTHCFDFSSQAHHKRCEFPSIQLEMDELGKQIQLAKRYLMEM